MGVIPILEMVADILRQTSPVSIKHQDIVNCVPDRERGVVILDRGYAFKEKYDPIVVTTSLDAPPPITNSRTLEIFVSRCGHFSIRQV